MLTQRQRDNRLKFCKRHQQWSEEAWKKVLWSDESTFTVTGCGITRVWRRTGSDALEPKFTCKTVTHPDSVMVWGCFGYHGVGSLVVLPKNETVNQYNYLEMLCDHLPDFMEKTQTTLFMQDGAQTAPHATQPKVSNSGLVTVKWTTLKTGLVIPRISTPLRTCGGL